MKKALCIILSVLALLTGTVSHGQTSAKKLESQRAQLLKDIDLLNKQLSETTRSGEKALTTLTLVRSKISKREALIADCDRSIRILDDSIARCNKQIKLLQERHDTLAQGYSRLVRAAYKNRDTRKWYMYVFASESVGQAFRRMGYFRSLSSQMKAQAQEIALAAASLEAEKARMEKLRSEQAALRSQVVKERSRLKEEENEASRLSSRLQKDRKKYQKQLADKNRQVENLNRKIADIVRRGQNSATPSKGSKGKVTSTEVDSKLSNEFAANKGRLPWPVEGVVTERFGRHRHPVYENVELPQNNGVTLTVKRGAKVHSVFNGRVTQIFVLPGYNQCVLVSHGAYFTLYTKLKSVSVKNGAELSTGQEIGTVDTIGGEDLFHFELWKGNAPQNPELWLR